MKELFIRAVLNAEFGAKASEIFASSMLLQYLDMKMGAVHGDSKSRRSLANIYAIYSILHFYLEDFFSQKKKYCKFDGYDFTKLFSFCRSLYGGSKLQNHAFNNRLNFEFKRRLPASVNDIIVSNNGKYLIHIDYLYVGDVDISKAVCDIVEKYISLLKEKDHMLITALTHIEQLKSYKDKKDAINNLLNEEAEARIFEIISYAILKNHFNSIKVYFGYSRDKIKEERLMLYKTGRTNANDGGIDFVMRPVGRFFQVTEVDNYDKYLLDIDKVMHFPVTFVIKTVLPATSVVKALNHYIDDRAHGMDVIRKRYEQAIEEIITINELQEWTSNLGDKDIDGIIRDINLYYRLEMNMDSSTDESCA